jgi:hypothetical protein
MKRTGADAFIAGIAVEYVGLDGVHYKAQFRRVPLQHVRITTAKGRRVRAPIMAEQDARAFFHNLPKGTP